MSITLFRLKSPPLGQHMRVNLIQLIYKPNSSREILDKCNLCLIYKTSEIICSAIFMTIPSVTYFLYLIF